MIMAWNVVDDPKLCILYNYFVCLTKQTILAWVFYSRVFLVLIRECCKLRIYRDKYIIR